MTFANLLHEIFDIDVPVGVIVSPATDLQALADYIEAQRQPGAKRPTFAAVHGQDATEVHARDLTLDKFIDAEHWRPPRRCRLPSGQVRTVLLTGATGFLGRYLALEWLERLAACRRQADLPGAGQRRRDGPSAPGQHLRQRRPAAAAPLPASWPPIIWRSSPATRANPTSAWIPRPGSGWPTPSI